MEKLALWWKKRSPRDRRAILFLSVVLPIILFWYLVTIPLQDALKMNKRVLSTRRQESAEVQKLLQEYSALHDQIDGIEFKASSSVVPELEQAFANLLGSDTRPILNRTNVVIFGKSQPAAHVRVNESHPQEMWRILQLVASSAVYISEIEISASEKKNEFSASIKAWLPNRE